ncbi:glycosyltransferase family 4 protein [Flavobacterium arcticum]|uniref:Glycosyltransferase family 4 protein n=1 Tax=Flavobacterium arcticum TaxID=1784713 RepID=A0A345HEC6_9FLAO|nr:glycosyltransferase family 4 protein [Flavobacterium arcticum]AXG74936.1 glycosyltransferase family 4 protein [Flavobacterium arcticum]KAF2506489.1 glycosyltransferase family 4 protein [Flavobacterium arcticum]
MKLLYIITNISGAGGMERILLLKSGYLAEHYSYDIHILITNPVDVPIHYKIHEGIKLHTIAPIKSNTLSYYISYKKLINEAVTEITPDVVIMCDNGLKSFLLPFIIKRKLPLVYERHVTKYKKEKPDKSRLASLFKDNIKSIFMDFCAKRYHKFIAVTTDGAQEWESKNVEVIPNPLWLITDKSADLQSKRLISIGRHDYQKGYDRLFVIWKRIVEKYPDWQLDIYGSSNSAYDIMSMAKKQGITTGINFYNPVADIESVYRNASGCLMASRYEGFGMVLLEAAACGVPSVAFDCPVGPKDIITNGKDGFLIKDGDVKAFVSAVGKLIEDEELRKEIGRNAKQKAKNFAIEPIMEKWDNLFKSLVKN